MRRLLRRLDNAGGSPTIKQWAQLVEADKAGRGEGAQHSRNYLPDWPAIADRIGNEKAGGGQTQRGDAPGPNPKACASSRQRTVA